MRKLLLFCLSVLLIVPAVAKAANAQAQEYDDLGLALYRQGLYAKSIPYFQNAVQADPTDWQGYENLGNAYFKINANPDALSAYQKSLQINPNNSTLENIVQTLQASATPVSANANTAPAAAPGNNPASTQPMNSAPPAGDAPPTSQSNVESDQPIGNNPSQTYATQQPGTTVVVQHRRRWRNYETEAEQAYADGLAPIDHAKFWTKLELGYTYASMEDFVNGAANINNGSYFNNDPTGYLNTTYSGSALASNSGAHAGIELGFLLNQNSGLAIGVKYAALNSYTANVTYNDSYADYENATLLPQVVPITLDYYFFMPDSGGRFYIKAGVGYYFSDIQVNESYSYSNFYNNQETLSPYGKTYTGDLTSGSYGFQLGIGREFAITRRFGIEIYVEGHYSKITNFQGTLYDQNGHPYNAGLVAGNTNGTIDFDNTSNIGSTNGDHYATLDYTGVDVGIAFNWYSF